MKKEGQTIAFTGGGTGGHVFPIVSLIEYAQNHTHVGETCKDFYRFGERDSLEEKYAHGLSDVQFVSVFSGKLRRYWTIQSTRQNIRDLVLVAFGVFQSLRLLKKYDIDVVFCKGGYVALPVCIAARVLGVRIVLHESDLHAGLTNRIVAKIAHSIFTGFDNVFPTGRHVGQILSRQLSMYDKSSLDVSHIDTTKTVALLMGGAQGSQVLCDALYNSLSILEDEYHFVVLLGTKNGVYRDMFTAYSCVSCYEFVEQQDIAKLYSLCDVAITRGSVTALAEQQLFGIKKLIVPLPYTGGNHQWYNGLWYAEQYDDIVLEEDAQLVENIQMFLQKLKGCKKQWDGVDGDVIEEAKKNIWDVLS